MSYPDDLARYSRQMLFPPIGVEGQRRLKLSSVTLIGCGALGSVLANTLVRAGIGSIRIIDRDFLELNNLQRQVVFDEPDVAAGLPKAEAAARHLRRVNSAVEIEPVVADVNPSNVEDFCAAADLLLDGTDNFETRYLVNDVAVKHRIPWIYGAVIASEGMVMPIIPLQTPCLRCMWDDPPPPGSSPSCDTAGVLSPAVNIVASLQAMEAIKLLSGQAQALTHGLLTLDVWTGRFRLMNMQSARDDGACPCCKGGRYEFLSGGRASSTVSLCGRNAVQVLPSGTSRVDLKALAARLGGTHRPTLNPYLLKFTANELQFTVFPDGRAIIQGTADPAAARSAYARYVGA